MKIQPTIVDDWELMDRGDGIEIRVTFKQGGQREIGLYDDDARLLAKTILQIQEWESGDRPITEGDNIV